MSMRVLMYEVSVSHDVSHTHKLDSTLGDEECHIQARLTSDGHVTRDAQQRGLSMVDNDSTVTYSHMSAQPMPVISPPPKLVTNMLSSFVAFGGNRIRNGWKNG